MNLEMVTARQCNMSYITNKFQSIRLPNEPGMLEWLLENYPHSGYYIVSALSSMDRIRGFEPCDVGSIPAGPTKHLKEINS